MKLEHEHPLTLVEDSGELRCPDCGHNLDESYSCKCDPYSYVCSLCNGRLSGSCYTCKLCCDSPIAHQSCFELPGEIQITYRPRCLLHLEKESSQSECYFCKQNHSSYKYCCEDCGFQICVGCSSKLIKYHHQGQQHVEHFSHRHPLTLLNLTDMNCELCHKNIDVAAYGCAPCEFFIHNSCLDLFMPEIRHDFHPKHSLTFQVYIEERNNRCDACRFYIQGLGYHCDECDFDLHPKCASLRPNIKYTGHEQHLLILVENQSYNSQCKACGFCIAGAFFMRCVECCTDFHVQCGSDHSLPSTVWHKEHKHSLILIIEEHPAAEDTQHLILYCNACEKERNAEDPFYRCVEPECEFFAHVRCTITEVQYYDEGKLRHFSHDHTLILRDIHKNNIFCCYGCGKDVQGPAYGCDLCQRYLHKSCAELPRQIYDSQFHEHYLALNESEATDYDGICDSCGKDLKGYIYHCDDCKIDLDLDCASLHPSVNLTASTDKGTIHEGQERIGHFSHEHHLTILEVAGVDCKLCYRNINDQCYGCAQCDFYIHKSCGTLLQEIQSPFHPRHSLKLLVTEEYGSCCNACLFDTKGLTYCCDECAFDLHPECISLKPNIQFQGHKHLLTLVENMSYQWQCEECGLKTLGTFFMRCVECNLNFHVQCGPNPLPVAILHKESGHLLTLRTETVVEDKCDQTYCIVCNKEKNLEHPGYYCADFKYYTHVRCAISKVPDEERAAQIDERSKMKHFSHRHFLLPLDNKGNDIICCACEKNIEDNLAYGCELCKFYLHKACAELPRERQHPFHRNPLFLPMPYYGEYRKCTACHKHYNGFGYHCQDCGFNLDLDCFLLFPSIKLESVHEHTLTLFKKIYDTPECDHCKFIPPTKVTPLDACYVRCVVCDFSRHLLCCPFPQIIKHDSHEHSLTLKDNFIDLFDGSDDDEYCCDVCETRQDARECVYHCEECNFVADVTECLYSEVMQFLEGKHKGVQGRIISRKINRKIKGLSYKHVIESLTAEEKKIMEPLMNEDAKKMRKGTDLLDIFKELREINQLANLKILAELSNIGNDFLKSMPMKVGQLESIDEELVDVGAYKICSKLAPILNNLLGKYGDIGASCPLAQRLKTIPLTTLCVIMQEMKDTDVIDIEEGSMILWWFHLKLIQRAGFTVDFALDHVKRVVHVRFLIDDESPIKSSPFYGIHKMIAERSKKIDEQMKEVEELKKAAEETVSSHGSERSILEASRLNETLKLSWKNAAAGLIDDI